MLFCPTCGVDRSAVPPIAACPRCGAAGMTVRSSSPTPSPPSQQAGRTNEQGHPRQPQKKSIWQASVGLPVLLLVVVVLIFWGDFSTCKKTAREIASSARTTTTHETLRDGESAVMSVGGGSFSVRFTATGDGASLKWVGSQCTGCKETTRCESSCVLPGSGQIQITNPTTLGLGDATVVSIEIEKH